MITGLFVSPDGESVRIEHDGAEGGIYEFGEHLAVDEVGGVPNDWTRWAPVVPVDDLDRALAAHDKLGAALRAWRDDICGGAQ